MNIWLVKISETLPIDTQARLYRMGLLAQALISRGHRVTWWSSTYNHLLKEDRFDEDRCIDVEPGFELELMHSSHHYRKNVSLARYLNNRDLCRKFSARAEMKPRPDLILSAMPTVELADVACRFAQRYRIPFLLDSRDMWPDVIADVLPNWQRGLARPLLARMERKLGRIAADASGLTSITEEFLDWSLDYARRSRQPSDGVFPLGFDASRQPGAAQAEEAERFWKQQGLGSTNVFKVCFMGTLNHTVELEPLWEAADCLGERVQFVICGGGDRLAEFVERGRNYGNVRFVGHQPPSVLWWLKKHCLAALLPIQRRRDYQASLSNKVFEYLAAGLPILSHLTGATGRVIEEADCGKIYNNGRELTGAIKALMVDDKKRLQQSVNATELFNCHYDSRLVYPRFAEHLESVVARCANGF